MTQGTSAAVHALGIPIPLADGTSVRLRYSMLSLERLEADFGDLTSIVDHVEGAARALGLSDRVRKGDATLTDEERAAAKGHAAIFTAITRVLLPGLLDAQGTDPRTGETVWLEERPDVAKRLLDPGSLNAYMDAFRESFAQAFHTEVTPESAGGAVPPQVAAAAASPGVTGTTSPVASPTAPMLSSGA